MIFSLKNAPLRRVFFGRPFKARPKAFRDISESPLTLQVLVLSHALIAKPLLSFAWTIFEVRTYFQADPRKRDLATAAARVKTSRAKQAVELTYI
ncbi:hypothetical protein DXT90_08365 [Agrobacterium tumefaciens]|nr:hypothetical protein [Agrobacterium tumefaciens]